MNRATKIQDAMFGLVGFNQPFNSSFAIVDAQNLESRSGYKVDDHSLIKIELIKGTQDYKDISDSDFNEVLRRIQRKAIIDVYDSVFNCSKFIDRGVLYPYAQNYIKTDTLPNGFVYHQIKLSNRSNLAFNISRVFLTFEGSGDIELLLFNTGSVNPIFSKQITVDSINQAVDLDWTVDNSNGRYKGDFYIGYIVNDDFTLKPYRRDYENASAETKFKYLSFFQKGIIRDHNTNTLFDLTLERTLSEETGLNFDVSIFNDYSDLAIHNENLFALAINLNFQIQVLEMYLNSLRTGRDAAKADFIAMRVIQELEGIETEAIRSTGIRKTYQIELDRLLKEVDALKIGFLGNGKTFKYVDLS